MEVILHSTNNSEVSLQSPRFSTKVDIFSEEKNSLFECSVCFAETEKFITFECGHSFCDVCVKSGLACYINNNSLVDLKCFNQTCQRKISEETIKKYVTAEVYSKYRSFMQFINIGDNFSIRYCPRSTCSQFMKILKPHLQNRSLHFNHNNNNNNNNTNNDNMDDAPLSDHLTNDQFKVTCTSCNYEFCYFCSEDHHPSFPSCKKYHHHLKKKKLLHHNSSNLKLIDSKLKAKGCPSCNYSITKDGGCNHVVCKGCGHEFCWLCLSPYTKTHFYDPNSPCYLLQFKSRRRIGPKKLISILFRTQRRRIHPTPPNIPHRIPSSREVNITIMGGCAIGKTPFITQFVQNMFTSSWNPTIADSYRRNINYENSTITLEINDYNGGEDFDSLREMDIRSCDAFLFMFSVMNRISFEKDLLRFYNMFKLFARNKPIVLVANMCDVNETIRRVSKEEAENLAREWNCAYFESSAKHRINVDEPFLELTRLHRSQF